MVAAVLGSSMKPLFDYVGGRGIDPRALVGHFGVELAHFEDPNAWIPVSLTDRIWEHAATLCEDPNLGLHVMATLAPGKGGVLSYLTEYSADFHAALDRLIRFFPLISQATRYELQVDERLARLTCHRDRPCPGRQAEEVSLAVVAQFGRRMWGSRFVVARASFRSERPKDLSEHVALFGPDLAFDASATRLELPVEMLRLPIRSADEQLAALLEVAARRGAPTAGDGWPARVRVQIAELLVAGSHAPCEDVASRIGMSPRTLRRRLAEHGKNYRMLHDEVLASMADQLLLDAHVPMDHVVARLRFSDLRALSNATRRWFGMTPHQYRQLSGERPRG